MLCAAEASAGSRISLLPFEGDRPKPLRWRVAYALKRAGHTVLGYAPPADRSSVGSLRDYADRRDVDLFVSGTSTETAQGWQLSLRFRGADGKAVGQPVTFRAESLKGLLAELRNEGPGKLERSVPGAAHSGVAELPAGRALPLPTRRARPTTPKSDRPVLPGAVAVEEADSDQSGGSPAAPKEVDLDAAAAARSAVARSVAGAGGGDSWDADAPDASVPAKGRSRTKDAATARSTRRAVLQRTASNGAMFTSTAPSSRDVTSRDAIDLDADTRSALEEAPKPKAKGKSRPSREAREDLAAADSAPEALPDPAAAPAAAASGDADSFDADEGAPPESEPAAKPKKKGGLFAGLSRKNTPTNGEDSKETTVEDSDPSIGGSTLRTPAHAQISGRAGFLHRTLEYSDDIYRRLRAPTTNGWVFRIETNLFPFAKPLKERFSLIGSYEGSLAGTVRDERAGRDFAVTFSELQGGARLRFPIGQHEIGTQATILRTAAGLDAPASVSGVPEISYVALRPAADLTMNFGPVSLRGAIGYQRTLGGFGEMSGAEWFPHMDGYGFDGQLGLDYRVSSAVTLQALGSVRRFVLDMNSRPDDAIGGKAEVAGGAVDQYLSGYFGVMFAL
jgi:hypothetical protein